MSIICGDILKTARLEKNLTLEFVAKHANCSISHVHNIENEGSINFKLLERIGKVVGVSQKELKKGFNEEHIQKREKGFRYICTTCGSKVKEYAKAKPGKPAIRIEVEKCNHRTHMLILCQQCSDKVFDLLNIIEEYSDKRI